MFIIYLFIILFCSIPDALRVVPSAPYSKWHARGPNRRKAGANVPVCYRVAFQFGDAGNLGVLSPARCVDFKRGPWYAPMFDGPTTTLEGATAMKIFRVDPDNHDFGCAVDILEVGGDWIEESETKTYNARCPNPAFVLTGGKMLYYFIGDNI